jgi:hypothetical protein
MEEMMRFRNAMTLAAPLLVLASGLGVARAQQQDLLRIDPTRIASLLELTDDQQRQIAPDLEELNQLFAQEVELRQEPARSQARMELMNSFGEVTARIGTALTTPQWRHFEFILDEAWAQSQGFDGSVRTRGMRGWRNDNGRWMDRDAMGYTGGMGWYPGCCRGDGRYYRNGSRHQGSRSRGWCR